MKSSDSIYLTYKINNKSIQNISCLFLYKWGVRVCFYWLFSNYSLHIRLYIYCYSLLIEWLFPFQEWKKHKESTWFNIENMLRAIFVSEIVGKPLMCTGSWGRCILFNLFSKGTNEYVPKISLYFTIFNRSSDNILFETYACLPLSALYR